MSELLKLQNGEGIDINRKKLGLKKEMVCPSCWTKISWLDTDEQYMLGNPYIVCPECNNIVMVPEVPMVYPNDVLQAGEASVNSLYVTLEAEG